MHASTTNEHTSCGRHDPVDFSFVESSFVWPREFPSEIKQASLLILDKGENTLLCKSTIDFVCLSISSPLALLRQPRRRSGQAGRNTATPSRHRSVHQQMIGVRARSIGLVLLSAAYLVSTQVGAPLI